MNMQIPLSSKNLPMRAREGLRRFNSLKPRSRLIIGIAAAAVLGFTAYQIWGGAKDNERHPPLVVTAVAKTKDVTVVEHAVGTVVANATVQVTAQVTGQLLRAAFQEGQIVKQGDLLFEIDPRPFQAALQQARAQLAKDTAQMVNAQSDRQRYDNLFTQRAISSQQRDNADATAKSTAASVEADRGALKLAELNLGYTRIRSPVDGKTGPILIQPGNQVIADGPNPLVVVTQIEPVKISFSLPQERLPRIQARAKAGSLSALVDSHQPGAAKLSAPVDFVSNQISNMTGTIELRANFANRDHTLVPGQMVDVGVTLGNLHQTVTVPREAVNDGPAGRYVYIVDKDGKAVMRTVSVLFDDGTDIALKGVRKGETVVIDGQLRVIPDAKVTIMKAHKTRR
jgi:membrane fusion protein, multidrug efflux system